MRLLLPLAPLLLFFPAAAPQGWYDPDYNYAPLPPEASVAYGQLEHVDLVASQRLVAEATGGRVLVARYVHPPEPRLASDACRAFRDAWVAPEEDGEDAATDDAPRHDERCSACATWCTLPEPHCEIQAFTADTRLVVRTDPLGTAILSQEAVPRFPGWPLEGEWVELPSGVKYYDVKVGKGKEPKNSVVLATVHFDGWLNDGTKFSSSYDKGRPMKSPISGAIKGWQEALLTMRVGGKRKIIIPPEMAYGAGGKAPSIPPNATLLYDVHLLKISRR